MSIIQMCQRGIHSVSMITPSTLNELVSVIRKTFRFVGHYQTLLLPLSGLTQQRVLGVHLTSKLP